MRNLPILQQRTPVTLLPRSTTRETFMSTTTPKVMFSKGLIPWVFCFLRSIVSHCGDGFFAASCAS